MKVFGRTVLATTIIFTVMVLHLGSGSAWATQIFIDQSGTSPAGGDPNLLTNTGSFDVGVAGISAILQKPLLLIVGVYDGNGTPSISYSGGVKYAPIGTYGLEMDSATFTRFSSGTAYTQLGLANGSGASSDSFGNWSGADVAHGLAAPSSFELYAFSLDTTLTGGSPISVDESGASLGSFIIGYDCLSGTGLCATGNIAATPLTNAGMISNTPEPDSWIFFGTGIAFLAIGTVIRKRRILNGRQLV